LRYGFTPTIASVTIVFIVVAATVFTFAALFGNLLRFLGADPATLERNRA
jgi:putative spermidine/putrescine transport system permease protein